VTRLLAAVVHLTDLHLFVTPNGSQRSIAEQLWVHRTMDRLLRTLRLDVVANQYAYADAASLVNLALDLPELVRELRDVARDEAPVIVAQTGDVEALGALDPLAFAGFQYLRDVLWPSLLNEGADTILDLFGNHDVWPGTLPLLQPLARHRLGPQRIAEETHVQPPFPRIEVVAGNWETPVELVPVNSVWTESVLGVEAGVLGGFLANGKVSAYLPGVTLPRAGSDDALVELARLPESRGALRIALMHHPLHSFDANLATRLTTGRVDNCDPAAAAVESARCHLLLAGHRHRLNPSTRGRVRAGGAEQDPLRTCGQLVAESPTVGDLSGAEPTRSVCAYLVRLDEQRGELAVDRLRQVFGLHGSTRITERNVLSGVPFP
jgi:hypothetical protein